MKFILLPIEKADLPQYKSDMQEAFQKGLAVVDGAMVGGAIVVINEENQHNHLDFLYVKHGTQSKGVGGRM